jgi:Flp pilus assembly protein TadG
LDHHHDEGLTLPERATARHRGDGQALVEFSLSIGAFLVLIIAIVDVGRAMYVHNGLSEAAREIARRTIVYPGVNLGSSAESQSVVATQQTLVPGMTTPTFLCVDVMGDPSGHVPCTRGDYVRVTVTAPYEPSVFLGMAGPITLRSSASMQIP